MEDPIRQRLSFEFLEIETICRQRSLTIGELLELLEARGPALLTLFLGMPFMMPLPLPGLSVPFGLLILLFGFSITTRGKARLPKSWLKRELSRDLVMKFCGRARKIFVKTERFFRPRHAWLVDTRTAEMMAGSAIALCGLLLALPLPPGTNSPPALAIVAFSIGLLEKDGVFILLGMILFVFNMVFFGLLAFLGYEGLLKLLSFAS